MHTKAISTRFMRNGGAVCLRFHDAMGDVVNVNVGVLGHVDSGKTTLAGALATTASTAANDKSPQSRERGITLDLGFSSFLLPADLAAAAPRASADGGGGVQKSSETEQGEGQQVQVTLVDCPGHASLIRTIMGGAQIIDLMLLVIDVTKGMQTQSAEGLVIGEITARELVVVLNKTDLIPEETREKQMAKVEAGMRRVLSRTRFKDALMVPVAAKDGLGLDVLMQAISSRIRVPSATPPTPPSKGGPPFMMAVDHCFGIRGQGTVLTGTVLNGCVSVNDSIDLPRLKLDRKVKSMQMFRKPVQRAVQGDRVGICVTQLDPKLIERDVIGSPGAFTTVQAAVVRVEKIPYFKMDVQSKGKYHVTIGHTTTMAQVQFFVEDNDQPATDGEEGKDAEHRPLEQLRFGDAVEFDFEREYLHADALHLTGRRPWSQWALLEFDKAVTCPVNASVIGSKLDTDIYAKQCRLAFYGRLAAVDKDADALRAKLRVYKTRTRTGVVDRVVDDDQIIGRGLFKKDTDQSLFMNLKLVTDDGAVGIIESSFGKTGKFKVTFRTGHGGVSPGARLTLNFKKFVGDKKKQIIQAK